MIIIQLKGGLGNQLFQYAAARALAFATTTDVKIDASSYSKDQLRNFDLSHLNVDCHFANEDEIKKLKAFNRINRIKNRIAFYSKKKFYKEPSFSYDSNFFNLSNDVYLQGYFQSEKYFKAVKDLILKEFQLKEISFHIQEFGERLKKKNSVAIHIRRGDYKDPEAQKMHGLLSREYYQNAIKKIGAEISDPQFYIFSDNVETIMQELDLPKATIVSGILSKTHYEDLYLMSQCRHNIIANSSFSWWGAWLNANPDKMVIAPKKWFNKGPKDTQDLIPEEWITI